MSSWMIKNDTSSDIKIVNHVCNTNKEEDSKSFTYCGGDKTCKLCRSARFVTTPQLYSVGDGASKQCMTRLVPGDESSVYIPDHSLCQGDIIVGTDRKPRKPEIKNHIVGADRKCSSEAIETFCDERTGLCTPCLENPATPISTYTPDLADAYQPCNQYGKCGSDHLSSTIHQESCATPGTRLFCDRTVPLPNFYEVSKLLSTNRTHLNCCWRMIETIRCMHRL